MNKSWMELELPPKMDGSPMTPEEEVRFWRFFYAESLRLFGDKKGTFESLTAKAMRLLKYDVQFFVSRGVPVYEYYAPPNGNKLERQKDYDEKRRKCWGKQHDPYALAWYFEVYTNPAYLVSMSKDAAIRKIKEEFRFPSFEAAYKALQRAGVKGLPSTW